MVADLSIELKVADLLSKMTMDEKIAQLNSVWGNELIEDNTFSEDRTKAKLASGIGFITCIGGVTTLKPAVIAETTNRIQSYLKQNTRLGIPAIFVDECLTGFMGHGATTFPQIIGVASTWSPNLVEQMTSIIREQMRAVGIHHGLSPVLDIARDPRWGRVEETFGEDPYLTSQMGISYVKGLRGEDLASGVMATGKHFVGYGAPEGGRNCAPALVTSRELHETYLKPFEAAIKEAHLTCMMTAYHELNGVPCTSSRELFTDILRQQLEFDGIVVSDFFAIDLLRTFHHLAKNSQESARLALQAGVDVELPTTDCFGEPLQEAIRNGNLDPELVNLSVRRILIKKFELSLFDSPFVEPNRVYELFDTSEQRKFARVIAEKSIVLLKNDKGLLPLNKDLPSIAIIGPNADKPRHMLGDYSYAGGIEYENYLGTVNAPPELVEASYLTIPIRSVLESITNKVSDQTMVHYTEGCGITDPSLDGISDAVEIANKSAVAVLVVGGKSGQVPDCTCGEFRDHTGLSLPGVQEELIRAVAETETPIVLVLINGRPLAIPWIAENISAIVEAWVPGEEGGEAIANVLFGDVNPGGKLPITFPRSVGQVPIYYNHKHSGGSSFQYGDYVDNSSDPLFPFGYGLSYTSFDFDNLVIQPKKVTIDGQIRISVDICNTGALSGDEVVQLYVQEIGRSVTCPVMELKGFQRITLASGETMTVVFEFFSKQLIYLNQEMSPVLEPGIVNVMIGSSSQDIRLRSAFEII